MMKLQVLVSAVGEEVSTLAERMHLESDAIIINQTDNVGYEEYTHNGRRIQCYNFNEKGVGLSRNNALMRAEADIILFSDEDIMYEKGYEKRVLDAFEEHPEADFLLFNMRVGQARATYYTKKFHRVHIWNAGRYPTYSFAVRRDKLHAANITFSLLFGGGAKYSNGEDSLFLKDCLKYGFKVYTVPVELGTELERESTWFKGYTDKFFLDRGVLYHFMYGKLAYLMAARFIAAHGKVMCVEIPKKNALALMKKGIESVEEY
jgi:glycosyltransferase involved in cell wall biosynthesis